MGDHPTDLEAGELRDLLHQLSVEEGFEMAGVVRPEPSEHGDYLRQWLDQGYHGEMEYLARSDAVERREDPVRTLEEARSVLVVGHGYFQPDGDGVPDDPSRGVIARYARGRDYHRVVKKKLRRVHRRLESKLNRSVEARVSVDTGPVLERELGQRAGLGWFGRNTMLIHPRRGSYFFLGALFLELELEVDEPFQRDHCGSCRACLDACPTGALLGRNRDGAPVMDARLCISYLTIENRGPIPRELRPLMGNRVYGCDICQEVCPFNVKFAEEAAEPGYAARGPGELPVGVEPLPGGSGSAPGSSGGSMPGNDVPAETFQLGGRGLDGGRPLHPGTDGPTLVELLGMALDEDAWEAFSRGSAIRRAGRAGFARNVCVGLGNWGSPEAVPVLTSALSDPEALVRGHAAWALGRVGSAEAKEALAARSSVESDELVRSELAAAFSA